MRVEIDALTELLLFERLIKLMAEAVGEYDGYAQVTYANCAERIFNYNLSATDFRRAVIEAVNIYGEENIDSICGFVTEKLGVK